MAIFGYLLCLLTSFLNPESNCYEEALKLKYKYRTLYVFGDSIYDSGNNQYLNNSNVEGAIPVWPYGETFFHHPTGRFSDGRIVPDFIAKLAKLPMPPPYLQPGHHQFQDGSNFASAGAGILVDTYVGTLNLEMQLEYFKAMSESLRQKVGYIETKNVLRRAVYLFSIGGNDIVALYSQNPNISESYQTQFVGMMIGNLTIVLQKIYKLGGRKIAFQNAVPLGCVPGMKALYPELGDQCDEFLSAFASLFNTAVYNVLKKLQTQLPGFKYSIFDYYNVILDTMNYPSRYGFKEAKAACCGSGAFRGVTNCGVESSSGEREYELCRNPCEYLWFDGGGHNTERANRLFAELFWSGPTNITKPYNVNQLFELA